MDNISFLYFLIATFTIALCIDWIIYLNEIKKKNKRQRIYRKMKNLNILREPVDPKFTNYSLQEFIHYEKFEKSELATLAYSLGKDDEISNFEFEMDYYWYCKDDLKKHQPKIFNLWKEYFRLFKIYHETEIDRLRTNLSQLGSLTFNAGIGKEARGDLDTKLLRLLENYYTFVLRNQSFIKSLSEILKWYNFRTEYYYKIMNIGTTETELYMLEYIYNNYEQELEKLRTDSPHVFLSYSGFVHHFYVNLPKYRDRNYDYFYRYIMRSRTAVFKHIGEYEEMSNNIFVYYKGQKRGKKGIKIVWDNILDYCTGYGEKPQRLLMVFFSLQVIFFFLLYPYPNSIVELSGLNPSNNTFENSIDILYFNTTTFVSNVYGNIVPVNWFAKLLVVIQQLLGFVVTGTLIALFLRKIFRD